MMVFLNYSSSFEPFNSLLITDENRLIKRRYNSGVATIETLSPENFKFYV